MAKLAPERQQAFYLKLLKEHDEDAFAAARGLLGLTPMGATTEEVISRSCQIIPLEIELGTMSGGLDNLVKDLKARNAFAEIEQVTEF